MISAAELRVIVRQSAPEMTKKQKGRKRTAKDLDEIADDLKPAKAFKLNHQPVDPDLPGDGQFYCIECGRYFISDEVLAEHRNSKPHKRRLRKLKDVPYSVAEAEAAGGTGSYSSFTKSKDVTMKNDGVS